MSRATTSTDLLSDPERVVFLAGAGISVASGLPSGWAFNAGIARILTVDAADADSILSLVTSGYDPAGRSVRFEQLMYVLRERLDPNLDILRCFDSPVPPTMLHRFLAAMCTGGATVFTTNFDSLIEKAIGDDVLQVYVEDEADEAGAASCRSFERWLASTPARAAVLKLHGTVRDLRIDGDGEDVSGIRFAGATLDRIGAAGIHSRLEPNKEAALRRALAGRVLCVIGYSGADDFDITPTLREALVSAAGFVWLRHDDVELEIHRAADEPQFLPEALRSATLPAESVIVRGRTGDAVRELFNYTCADAPGTRVDLDAFLTTLAPYRSLTPAKKHLVAARLAEEATRNDLALRLYAEAARRSRRRDSRTYGYALFRQGHLQRVRGDHAAASTLLRRALAVLRRAGDDQHAATVLNAIGNTYLVRGMLKNAAAWYAKALTAADATRNDRLAATVINNLGLAERKRGNYAEAIKRYEQALAIDQGLRDRAGMLRDLGNKATALLLLGRHDEAGAAMDEGLRIERLIGREELVAVTLANRGILHRRLGQLDEADRCADEAMAIEQRLERREGIARCISLRAGILAKRHLLEAAIAAYDEAIAIQRELHARDGIAVDLESRADCRLELGDSAAAAADYDESATLYSAVDNRVKAEEMREKAATSTRIAPA